MNSKPFILAEWTNIVMFSWVVDGRLLKPFLPNHTALDYWKGNCYISLVALYFDNVKIKGWTIPFHKQFPMINLRFYVRQLKEGRQRKGVVFIREITSKPLISIIANYLYNEHFKTYTIQYDFDEMYNTFSIRYKLKFQGWNSVQIKAGQKFAVIEGSSLEEWITERFWGCTKMKKGGTQTFEVWHPKWSTHPVKDYNIKLNFGKVYGGQFQELENRPPDNVLFTRGSEVKVQGII